MFYYENLSRCTVTWTSNFIQICRQKKQARYTCLWGVPVNHIHGSLFIQQHHSNISCGWWKNQLNSTYINNNNNSLYWKPYTLRHQATSFLLTRRHRQNIPPKLCAHFEIPQQKLPRRSQFQEQDHLLQYLLDQGVSFSIYLCNELIIAVWRGNAICTTVSDNLWVAGPELLMNSPGPLCSFVLFCLFFCWLLWCC